MKKILSICIPTYKRAELMTEMLKSIYSQGVDENLFEVCVSDNSPTDELDGLVQKYSCHANFVYKKSDCKGFMNSIEALKLGSGKFLKLLNDYSIFRENALSDMIDFVKSLKEGESAVTFGMGSVNNTDKVASYKSFNDFMYAVNKTVTWSTAFAIWKSDFDRIIEAAEPNYMYPHTTLLFMLTDKKEYIVNNHIYVANKEPKKKGGYNLTDNFIRIFLSMVKEMLLSKKVITDETYFKIEERMLDFVAYWYFIATNDERYTFSFDDTEQIIMDVCGEKALKLYKRYFKKYKIKQIFKNIYHSLKGLKK